MMILVARVFKVQIVDGNGSPVRANSNELLYTDVVAPEEQRLKPRLTGTGATRGTQTIGYGKIKIDGSNDKITLTDDESVLTIGDLSVDNDSYGFGIADPNGNDLVSLGRTTSRSYGLSAYDANNMRLHAGMFPSGDIKIKLSQLGVDVLTATDDQLVWSSDFKTFKIIDSGTKEINKAALSASEVETVSHTLGYAPLVIAFATQIGVAVQNPVPDIAVDSATGLVSKQAGINVTATGINFYVLTPSWAGNTFYTDPLDYFFRYYILQETAE